MLRFRCEQIDACGLDRAVTEHIGELGDVLGGAVVYPCEQMPEVVRKHLAAVNVCLLANCFHFAPDLFSGNAVTAFGDEKFTGSDFVFLGVFQQLLAELARQQDRADLALQMHPCGAVPDSIDRDIFQFRYADTRCAYRLHDQRNPYLARLLCRVDQPQIFVLAQIFLIRVKQPFLDFEILHPAVDPGKAAVRVNRGDLGIDRHRQQPLLCQQIRLPSRNALLRDLRAVQVNHQLPHVTQVLLDRPALPLLRHQPLPESIHRLFRNNRHDTDHLLCLNYGIIIPLFLQQSILQNKAKHSKQKTGHEGDKDSGGMSGFYW